MHKIDAFPSINIHNRFFRLKRYPSLVREDNFTFYSSARAALFHIFQSLNLPKDCEILFPAFHCGVEVESAVKAGLSPKFYGIKDTLTIDFSDLKTKVSTKTRMIIVIHYFGFPQDIEKLVKLCEEQNILLVEDCAHALFSKHDNQFLGTYGAYGFYSLAKTLPVPNGGGCLQNDANLPKPIPGKHFFHLSLVKTAVKSVLNYEMTHNSYSRKIAKCLIDWYHLFRPNNFEENRESARVTRDWSYDLPAFGYENTIWRLSKRLVKGHSSSKIIEKRRRNYQIFDEIFQERTGISRVFSSLPSGTCPLCFPIFVENRDALADTLKDRGISSYIFGKFLHPLVNLDHFPEALILSKNILGLPIHQQLAKEDILHLATTINNLC